MASVPSSTSGPVDVEQHRKRPKHERLVVKMLRKHPEIVCFALAVVFSGLSQYANRNNFLPSRSETRHQAAPPLPSRFFSSASSVIDFPFGNLATVGSLVETHEVLAVMYYAPWCANSMHVRPEFQKAALYLKGQIQFIGVNCWYKKGQCRQQNKFYAYPVLFFYIGHLNGIKYNGILRADYIVNFAKTLLHPLQYLSKQEDLASVLATSDNLVVGYFDFHSSPQPPGFQQFYYASLRTLEADPHNVVAFGVVSGESLATMLEVNTSSTVLMLRSLNTTLKYPAKRNMTSRTLTAWALTYRQQPIVKWILPSGLKSISLSSEIEKGPAVLLFTDALPLHQPQHQLTQLREVALSYGNCNNESRVQEAVALSMLHRLVESRQYIQRVRQCENHEESEPDILPVVTHTSAARQCCISLLAHSNSSCDMCVNYEPLHPLSASGCGLHHTSLSWFAAETLHVSDTSYSRASGCQEALQNYNPNEFLTLCCDNSLTITKPTHHNRLIDLDHSSSRDSYIFREVEKAKGNNCKDVNKKLKLGWIPSLTKTKGMQYSEVGVYPSSFIGSGCHGNRTLNFYAMDSRMSGEFAQRLGVNLSSYHSSALVLVDTVMERISIQKKQISPRSALAFVEGHTADVLERSLRSSPLTGPLCLPVTDHTRSEPCIHEVTTKSFSSVVMDDTKDVVLLYYAPWCAFCAALSHIYLSLAKYFRSSQHIIFARINGDANDLAWEFTTDTYPVISLYPANQKMNSVSFADHAKLTLPNLVEFVLQHASVQVKVDVGLSVCSPVCLQSNSHLVPSHRQLIEEQITALKTRLKHVTTRCEELAQDSNSASNPYIHSLHTYRDSLEFALERRHLQLIGASELDEMLADGHHLDAEIIRKIKTSLSLRLSQKHNNKSNDVERGQ